MIDNILDTVAYGLALLGLLITMSSKHLVSNLQGAGKGGKKQLASKNNAKRLVVLLFISAVVLLIVSTWMV